MGYAVQVLVLLRAIVGEQHPAQGQQFHLQPWGTIVSQQCVVRVATGTDTPARSVSRGSPPDCVCSQRQRMKTLEWAADAFFSVSDTSCSVLMCFKLFSCVPAIICSWLSLLHGCLRLHPAIALASLLVSQPSTLSTSFRSVSPSTLPVVSSRCSRLSPSHR